MFALLALATLASPARAQHCGAYAIRTGDKAIEIALGLSSTLSGDEARTAKGPSPAKPVPGRPCDGPSCSKAPAAPSPSSAPSDPTRGEHWAIAAQTSLADPLGRTTLPSSEAVHCPTRPIGGVFHPPRPR